MRMLFLKLGLFSVVIAQAACSSQQGSWQRAYIDAEVLTDGISPSDTSKKRLDRHELIELQRRKVHSDGYDLSMIPITPPYFDGFIEEMAFKKGQTTDEKEKSRNELSKYKKGCFNISLSSLVKDAANLNYFTFALEDSTKRVKRLVPQKENSSPNAEIHYGSYSTGGYSVGNTYIPSTSHLYSYANYSSLNIYCVGRPIEWNKGFVVYVEPRFARNRKIQDLVWATNSDSKVEYRHFPGMPYKMGEYYGADLTNANAWVNTRYEQNQKVFQSAD